MGISRVATMTLAEEIEQIRIDASRMIQEVAHKPELVDAIRVERDLLIAEARQRARTGGHQ